VSTPFDDAGARVARGADHHDEARQLVAQMTLEEKLGCLDGDTPFWSGLVDMSGGGYYTHTWPAAQVPRLGIPGIEFADGPRGCVVGDATAFPVSMARGAAFDPELERRVGEAIGAELRASGATYTGAVCMNLLRHPAWGRAQETYGEDPHHVGVMAEALTEGLQAHVMACMKHFALNSMENARFKVDVTVGERALHEVYLAHFERVAASGVASVMSAYNSVNGEWCGQNTVLLTDILRTEWGWDGFVISDFIFGLRDPALSVRAGLDIEMPFRQQRALYLPDALAAGDLSIDDVDAAVARIVGTLLRFAEVYRQPPPIDVVGCDAHRALAREAAAASMVLLRNDGVLPVDAASIGRVAVLGALATMRNLGDGGSSDVRSTHVVSPLDGIRARFADAEVVHDPDDVSIVDGSDLVVVVVGYTKHDEGEYMGNQDNAALAAELFPPRDHPTLGVDAPYVTSGVRPRASRGDSAMAPGGDRSSLRLSEDDESLIAAACAHHDRVVVAVVCGSAVVMPWADSVPSVVVTWYCGVEGGAALAGVIAGDTEPAGRLPFAIPYEPDHLVGFDPHATSVEYGLLHGQWKLDSDGHRAHFPFGWGLGFADLRIESAAFGIDGNLVVAVSNAGTRGTSSVVFVHAGLDSSAHVRPPRRLVGFARVRVDADATAEVSIEIDWSMLDLRLDGDWVTEAGTYTVEVGRFAGDPQALTVAVER
jgi:beta-glucosidase